ncbi:MAG: hypothetical protein ACKO96_36295 [Flammeovirgaceae bacterium]
MTSNPISLEIKLDQKNDTIWLTQDQLSLLSDKERSVISKHIKNIFADEELEEKRVCAFFARIYSKIIHSITSLKRKKFLSS